MRKRVLSAALAILMALALVPLTALAATNEVEPNDTAATAMAISVNQEYTGNISTNGDKDYYKFTLSQNEVVTVSYDFGSGRSNHRMQVFDSNQDTIASVTFTSDSTAFPYKTNRYNLPAGEYYVYIAHYSGTLNSGAYTINVKTETQVSNRETEYNNSMSTANSINVNTKYVGNLSQNGDKDYYKFTIPGNGLVTLSYEATGGRSNMKTVLYNSNSESIISNTFTSDNNVFPHTSDRYRLPAGTYYVYVCHYSGELNNNDYYLTVNYTDESGKAFEVEDNGATSLANTLTLNSTITGNLSENGDKDYYKFTLGAQTSVSLIYSATGGRSNMRVALYDSNSTALSSNTFTSDNYSFPYTTEAQTLPAGTYYVYIAHYSGTLNNNDYTITATNGGAVTTPPVETPPVETPPVETPVETPPVTTPGTAGSFSGTESLNVGVKFTWSAMSGGVGYRIYRSEVSGSEGISVTDFYITDTQFIDVNVDANKTYYYCIRQVISEARPFEGKSEVLGPASAQVAITTQSSLVGGNASSGTKPKQFITMTIDNPYMSINGLRTEIDPGRGTTPLILNSRTVVPIRAIVEGMGGTVGWNANSNEISLAYGSYSVRMWLENKTIQVNGSSSTIDVAPTTINSRTMVPIRFAAENLGCEVDWLNSERQVVIVFR